MKKLFLKMNRLFVITVLIPTIIAILYYGLIASDVFIAESHFVVRSPQKQAATGVGAILQSAGFTRSQDDTYTVHDYMHSHDAMLKIDGTMPLKQIYRKGDFVSRFNPVGIDDSYEALHDYYQDKIEISLDGATSISVLRVHAYTAEDAYKINLMLLDMGENLINQLNERGRQDLIRSAQSEVNAAIKNAESAALSLSKYQNSNVLFDPEKQSAIKLQQVSKMQDELLTLRSLLGQLQSTTSQNPQIPGLRRRISLLDREIDNEMSKIAGGESSFTGQTVDYEQLQIAKGAADKQLAVALTSLEQARNDAQRKQLYLERIVQPNKPDVATAPKRMKSILATVLLALIFWGILTIIMAGVHQHRD